LGWGGAVRPRKQKANSEETLHCSHATWIVESELILSPLFILQRRRRKKEERGEGTDLQWLLWRLTVVLVLVVVVPDGAAVVSFFFFPMQRHRPLFFLLPVCFSLFLSFSIHILRSLFFFFWSLVSLSILSPLFFLVSLCSVRFLSSFLSLYLPLFFILFSVSDPSPPTFSSLSPSIYKEEKGERGLLPMSSHGTGVGGG
jgi:hypothetical protein